MAEGNVQLKLQVSLDTVYIRQQLEGLGTLAKRFPLNIVPKIDSRNLAHLVKSVGKKITVNINDAQLQLLSTRLDSAQEKLAALKSADNKIVIGVTAKAAVTQKDARRVRSGVYRSIMENGGKILLPVGLQPISQAAVNAFKADLQKKLGSINVTVGATTSTTPATGQGQSARRPSYLDAPAFKTELEKLSRATFAQLQKGASGLREGRTRSELERLLSQFAQTNPQGAQRNRDLNALREMLALGRYQQGLGIEARMASGGGGQGPLGKSLDTFARGLFRMLGMDPAQLRAEEQARRAAAARPANAPTPFGLLPSITRRTQTAQGVNALMQGAGSADEEGPAGRLSLSAEALRRRVDAILAQYFKVVEAQVREEFGGAELRQNLKAFAYMAQALRDAEQRTREARIGDAVHSLFQKVERVLNNAARAAESQAIRNVRVVDLNAISTARSLPMLPPAGGSGGGRDRVTGSGEPPQPRGGALVPYAQRTDLPSGYIAGAQMARALGNADQYLRQSRVPLAGAIAELSGEFAQATKQVLLYGTAYKALAFFMDLPNQALNAATALQTFRNQLNAITGSADNANRSFGFIDGLANRFAVPLESARQGFVKLYASMSPAGFQASEIEGLFSGISKAAATFGLSSDKVDRVTYAFSQMASKGQIMAEELRGQLGDVLPGSLALFAKAAQMELPEFTKAMEDGRFSGEAMRVVLNNVAILLNQQFAKGADGAAKTLQGALNQMQNSLQRLYEAFEPLVAQVGVTAFPLISSAIKDATKAVQAFAAATQGNQGPASQLAGNAQKIYIAMRQLLEIAKAVASTITSLGPLLQSLGESLLFVTTQVARFVNTPVGGFLASFALKLALATAALQLFARTGILSAVAALLRMITAMRAGSTAMIALGNGARAAGLSMATLRTSLLAFGSTAVLAGVMLLVERFMMLRNAVDGVRQSTQNMLGSISSMAQSGAVDSLRNVGADIQKQIQTFEQLKPFVSGGAIGPQKHLPADVAEKMREIGLGGFVGTTVFGKPYVNDFVNASKVINERLAGLRKQAESVSQKLPEAMEAAKSVAATANQSLVPIPPGEGDAEKEAKLAEKAEKARQAALEKQQRDAERGADQQRQLITATAEFQNKKDQLRFQHLETLSSSELDHAMAMIDARHNYELAGANEIHARQLRYYKEQKDIQLRNLRSVRDAMGKIQDAQMRLEAARRSKAAVEQAASIMPAQSVSSAGGSGNANLTGYLTRLSYLETRLKNVPNAEGSGAMGFFQTKGPFHGEATAASGGKNSRSSNFAEASQAVASWIEKHRPEAYSAILGGQFDKADAILRVGTWPSLPGGSQAQPSAVQAQARQYLPGGALAAQPAPALPASRPMPSLKKGGVFQGFPVTGVPGENRAYRGGTHEGYDIATPMNTALSYAIGGIVKRIDNVGKGNIGKMVEVELENGVIGFSGHLNEVLVQAGQRFTANQIIARTGDTGAGGIHLHQESAPFGYKKGRAAESMAYLQLGGARVLGAAASGPRHSMAKAGQEASFDVELAKLELANVKAENIKKVIQELSVGSEQLRASLAAQVAEVFPVEQMEMEAALMERRNQLVMAGAPSEYIEAQQSIAKGDMERVVALQYMTTRLEEIKAAQAGFAEEIAKGGPYADFFKEQLRDAESGAKLYEDAIAGLGAEQQRFNLLVLEGALAELKNADALKAMQEAVGMVKGAVEGVMGSYKNFVGDVLKGGSLKDAAKRLQEALRDQAVTMFLDFAMKPMQKFLEDSLLKVFGLESEEQQRQKSIAKLQEQINLLSQIRDNTAKVSGPTSGMSEAGQSLGLSSYAAPIAGGIFELPQVQSAFQAASQIPIQNLGAMRQSSQALQGFQMEADLMGAAVDEVQSGLSGVNFGIASSVNVFKQAGGALAAANQGWQASLGNTVSAVGMAAGAITSIAGGVSQIKEGGISGALGGIGSIFMGVGGALGGFGGAGGLGGLFGGGSSFASNIPLNFASAPNIFGQLAVPGFANGGIVNGPTLGLVGEGKYNEAIVPLPDGRSIPVKMAGGQSAREAMSNGGMPSYAPSTVSFSFETTKINGVEYVSRDQLELAMASTRREAIKEGAKRGMSMTLDKIQQSPGTRRSIAMGRR